MDSLFKPGDLIALDCWFYVYELVDDYGIVFYIGISKDPAYRFRSHANPKHCDSTEVCEEIASCKAPKMRIVSVHPTKEEALRAEARRVLETPGVLNDVAHYSAPKKTKARTSEYYRQRRIRRAQRDASKLQKSQFLGEVRPRPLSGVPSPPGALLDGIGGVARVRQRG